MTTPTTKQDWEEEFDHEFVRDNGPDVEDSFRDPNGDVGPVKAFIRSLLASTERKTREETLLEIRSYLMADHVLNIYAFDQKFPLRSHEA